MPREFDQEAKDRVVCFVEDRILVEKYFNPGSVQDRGTETGCLVA
ncbi:hypothetical protein [Corynebacterium pseudodiphtheriticum]|nr:hypothetical protein [Corynebacterium pseudodiphtheriticum]MDK4273756.1 hypothetical protein [Corynebacterium pseudodiphtheriticum]